MAIVATSPEGPEMHQRTHRHAWLAAVAIAAALSGACNTPTTVAAGEPLPVSGGGVSGARCLPDAVDCEDTAPVPLGFDPERYVADASALLGAPEEQLPDTIRVARRGEEAFVLTDDHQVGRYTVDLDDDGSGTYVVTRVTVELVEGSETVTR